MRMAAIFLAAWTQFVLPMKLSEEEGGLWTKNGGIILAASA